MDATMNNYSTHQPANTLDYATYSTRQAIVEMRSKRKTSKKSAFLGADILRTRTSARDRSLGLADPSSYNLNSSLQPPQTADSSGLNSGLHPLSNYCMTPASNQQRQTHKDDVKSSNQNDPSSAMTPMSTASRIQRMHPTLDLLVRQNQTSIPLSNRNKQSYKYTDDQDEYKPMTSQVLSSRRPHVQGDMGQQPPLYNQNLQAREQNFNLQMGFMGMNGALKSIMTPNSNFHQRNLFSQPSPKASRYDKNNQHNKNDAVKIKHIDRGQSDQSALTGTSVSVLEQLSIESDEIQRKLRENARSLEITQYSPESRSLAFNQVFDDLRRSKKEELQGNPSTEQLLVAVSRNQNNGSSRFKSNAQPRRPTNWLNTKNQSMAQTMTVNSARTNKLQSPETHKYELLSNGSKAMGSTVRVSTKTKNLSLLHDQLSQQRQQNVSIIQKNKNLNHANYPKIFQKSQLKRGLFNVQDGSSDHYLKNHALSPKLPNQPAVFQYVAQQVRDKVHNQSSISPNLTQTYSSIQAYSPNSSQNGGKANNNNKPETNNTTKLDDFLVTESSRGEIPLTSPVMINDRSRQLLLKLKQEQEYMNQGFKTSRMNQQRNDFSMRQDSLMTTSKIMKTKVPQDNSSFRRTEYDSNNHQQFHTVTNSSFSNDPKDKFRFGMDSMQSYNSNGTAQQSYSKNNYNGKSLYQPDVSIIEYKDARISMHD